MAEEASVRMTVDSSQALTENQKYVRAATETFNVLHQKSVELGISKKQRVQWMGREIELMKERSLLSTSETVNRIYDDPKLSGKDKSRLVRETRTEGREDIEELKQVNKQLKLQSETQKIAEQKSERLGQSMSRIASNVLSADTAGGMISGTSTGALGALGAMGAIAGLILSKAVKGAAAMEPATRDYSILRNQTITQTQKDVERLDFERVTNLGMKPSEYYTKYAQLTRAGAGVVNEDILGIIAGEKAKGVNLSGVMSVERYGEGKVTNIERYFEKYLRATSQNIAVLPEILQTFTSEANAMMRVTSKVDSASIAGSIAAISKGFNLTEEPLQNVYSTMRQGLQQSTNPVMQSLQYSVMERAMPKGTSLWQMEKAMENPMTNPKYVTGMLDQLRLLSGGDQEQYARAIFNAGLAPSKNIADMMSRTQLTTENFTTETEKFKKIGVGGYDKEAVSREGALEKATAKIQGTWEKQGFTGGSEQLVSELTAAMNGVSAGLEKINTSIWNAEIDQVMKAQAAHTKIGKWIHEAAAAIIAAN